MDYEKPENLEKWTVFENDILLVEAQNGRFSIVNKETREAVKIDDLEIECVGEILDNCERFLAAKEVEASEMRQAAIASESLDLKTLDTTKRFVMAITGRV
jgi:hypothetical protein